MVYPRSVEQNDWRLSDLIIEVTLDSLGFADNVGMTEEVVKVADISEVLVEV